MATVGCPFRLRQGVVERLLIAQAQLQRQDPALRLAIFDAWRRASGLHGGARPGQ